MHVRTNVDHKNGYDARQCKVEHHKSRVDRYVIYIFVLEKIFLLLNACRWCGQGAQLVKIVTSRQEYPAIAFVAFACMLPHH